MENQDFRPINLSGDFRVEVYTRENHLDLLDSWLLKRGLPKSKNLPALGFVIFEGERPVSMAFIRSVEGGLGICDGLCTNPEIPGPIRAASNDRMIDILISAARLKGMSSLVAWSVDSNTLERAYRHGFNKLPNTLIVHPLVPLQGDC